MITSTVTVWRTDGTEDGRAARRGWCRPHGCRRAVSCDLTWVALAGGSAATGLGGYLAAENGKKTCQFLHYGEVIST
jgi:hypothetical protein